MKIRRLGSNGPKVSAIGLGCMGMSEIIAAGERYAPAMMALLNQ